MTGQGQPVTPVAKPLSDKGACRVQHRRQHYIKSCMSFMVAYHALWVQFLLFSIAEPSDQIPDIGR